MTRDLTKGSPFQLILAFALPTLIGLLFQQLYSVVDSMIVGKLLGSQALASVGSTSAIQFMVLGFCIGICSGFAIPVAQRLGGGDLSKMRVYVWNSLYLSIGFSLVLALGTGLFSAQILTAMNTPSDIYQGAYDYIVIIFFGIPACFLYNMPASIIRSLGDSKTPVYFLALASGINIVLDFLFIIYFDAGVAGAAIATIIAQAVSGFICVVYMGKKYPVLQSTSEERKFSLSACGTLCYMGIPMGLQYSITAIGSIILQTAVNGLGSLYVAAMATIQKLFSLFVIPYDALGATMATYCGQNVGALKFDRLGQGLRTASLMGFIYSVICLVFLYLTAPSLCLLFLNSGETQLIELASQGIVLIAVFFFPLSLVNIVRFAIQGMGYSQFAILAGVLEMIARTLVACLFVPQYGFVAACLASPAAWILADMFLVPGAMYCISRLRRKYGTTQAEVGGESQPSS